MLSKEQKEIIKKQMESNNINQNIGVADTFWDNNVSMFCKIAQALDLQTKYNEDEYGFTYDFIDSFKHNDKEELRNAFRSAIYKLFKELEGKESPYYMFDYKVEFEDFFDEHLIGPENSDNWDKVFSYMEESDAN